MSLKEQAKSYAEGALLTWDKSKERKMVHDMLVNAFTAGAKLQRLHQKQDPKEIVTGDIRHIIDHLNSVTGRKYRVPTGKVLAEMKARLCEEGVTVHGVTQMITRQWKVWEGRTGSNGVSMQDYVRPSTLFRPDNFNNYYANKDLPVKAEQRRNSLRNLPYHEVE